MKERPILFSESMVLAILDGSKTQTRRIAKKTDKCPYGQIGDTLYVRESHAIFWNKTGDIDEDLPHKKMDDGSVCYYSAGVDSKEWFWRKTPSIYMPKEASRIKLKITNVRLEKLQDKLRIIHILITNLYAKRNKRTDCSEIR